MMDGRPLAAAAHHQTNETILCLGLPWRSRPPALRPPCRPRRLSRPARDTSCPAYRCSTVVSAITITVLALVQVVAERATATLTSAAAGGSSRREASAPTTRKRRRRLVGSTLFNGGEYHACHDVVEELWYAAEDPARTLLHAILQCAVGFHHLFNQNHRGAMMELGEGLCKLRKLSLDDDGDDPFARFRDEVAAVLQFLYRTQKELAACTDDLCLAMDGSASSYRLLGNFAAGQQLYHRFEAADNTDDGAASIIFSVPDNRSSQAAPAPHGHRVKLPTLHATEQNLTQLQSSYQYM